MIERAFNHCARCGVRIPWRKRAFFGNTYKPYVCMTCANEGRALLYGSVEAADSALWAAAVKKDREHGWPR